MAIFIPQGSGLVPCLCTFGLVKFMKVIEEEFVIKFSTNDFSISTIRMVSMISVIKYFC